MKNNRKALISNPDGFTLIEMMVTIAIFAIMSGIAGYSYLNGLPERKVIKSVRELYSGIQDARSEAVSRGQDITITFNSNNFIITDPNDVVIRRHDFPDYIDIYQVTAGGANNRYTFNTRGMKTGVSGRVRMKYSTTGPLKRGVRVTSAGGISMIDETDANWL